MLGSLLPRAWLLARSRAEREERSAGGKTMTNARVVDEHRLDPKSTFFLNEGLAVWKKPGYIQQNTNEMLEEYSDTRCSGCCRQEAIFSHLFPNWNAEGRERDRDTRIFEASMERSCSAVQQLLAHTYPTSFSTGFLRHRPLWARASCSWSQSTWWVFTQCYSTARVFFFPTSLPKSNSSIWLVPTASIRTTFMFSDILGKIQPGSKVIGEEDLPFPLVLLLHNSVPQRLVSQDWTYIKHNKSTASCPQHWHTDPLPCPGLGGRPLLVLDQ